MINSPWAIRVARAGSSQALDRLMDIGFDSHMKRKDWESARRSIEQTYGRSSLEHRQTLDTLSAAIRYRSVFGRWLTG